MIFDFKKRCDLEPVTLNLEPESKVTQGHWEWYHSIDGFILVFFSNFVPKMHRFWDILL